MKESDVLEQNLQDKLAHVEEMAHNIGEMSGALKMSPHNLMEREDRTQSIMSHLDDMSRLMQEALDEADDYRDAKYDNPACPFCGTEQEVAVTSSNITGFLCPVCDGEQD